MSLASVNFFLVFSTIIRSYIASATMETWLARCDKPAYANEVYGELFYAIGLSPGEEWRERDRVAVSFGNKKKIK